MGKLSMPVICKCGFSTMDAGEALRHLAKCPLNRVECPHIIRKHAGDESWDFCELTERPSGRIKPCLLTEGLECETWAEIQKEWQEEAKQ